MAEIYAVIQTGGKQYRVEKDMEIEVELLDSAIGAVLSFVDLLNGKTVKAKVIEHGKGEKLNIFKYKPKKNIRKRMGHRQPYTKIKVTAI